MDLQKYLKNPAEKPLDNIPADGGFAGIFRKIGCIGDSLSSGEFESLDAEGKMNWHDYYEYSWGQHMARNIGSTVYNFSKGGMSAEQYCEGYADSQGFWNQDKLCQAYILAMGVNDISVCMKRGEGLGDISDIDFSDYTKNKKTFLGYYAQIIQRLQTMQPKAKFFLMTIPRSYNTKPDRAAMEDKHRELLYALAEKLEYVYVLDFRQYAPVYDEEFYKQFFLGGHMNPAGYILTARMVAAYLDYIIRNHMEDFAQVGFLGTPYHNVSAKW